MYAKRRDKNHKDICDELEKRGVQTLDLSGTGEGVPDIATWHRGKTVFVELKFGSNAELKKTQVRFLSMWRGYAGIARTVEAAYALATEPETYCLTQSQKDRLAAFYLKMAGKQVVLNTIEKMIELNR